MGKAGLLIAALVGLWLWARSWPAEAAPPEEPTPPEEPEEPEEPETHVGNFLYSSESIDVRYYTEINPYAGTGTVYMVFNCLIVNQGAFQGTRDVSLYYQSYSRYYDRWNEPRLVKTTSITLTQGQSASYVYDPRVNPGDKFLSGRDSYDHYMYLADSAGGESEHVGSH